MPGRSRDFTETVFNRGINLVSDRTRISRGQLLKAENVVFTRNSIQRRLGKLRAYERPDSDVNSAVAHITKFYFINRSGGVYARVFMSTTEDQMYVYTSNWSDSSKTLITGESEITVPNTVEDSLYSEYSSPTTTIDISDGTLNQTFQTQTWLYINPDIPTTTDSTVRTTDVPLRTQLGEATYGTRTFLHGLVPPASLVVADVPSNEDVASTWTETELSSSGGNSSPTSIAIDSSDVIHAVYQAGGSVMYRFKAVSATSWSTEEDTGIAIAGQLSLALTSQGVPAIVYFNSSSGDVEYAIRDDGSTWNTQSIDTDGTDSIDLVFDSSDNPHIVYIDQIAGDDIVRYASKTGPDAGAFTTTEAIYTPGGGTDAVGQVSIAVDSNDDPHVSFVDENGAVLYDNRIGGSWSAGALPTTVDAGSDGQFTAIDIQSSDSDIGVFFWDGDANRWAYNTSSDTGGTWGTTETVESTGAFPALPSPNTASNQLEFDSNDIAHVAYRDGADREIHYAKRSGGTWTTKAVQTMDWTGAHCSLALDSNDDPCISYLNNTDAAVRVSCGDVANYRYKLTAEYDDGKLGESGANDELQVKLDFDIDATNTHDIDIDDVRYNMTKDVTKFHIYRTVRGGASAGPYYRAGSVDVSGGDGNADNDFTDNVPDSTLVNNIILDTDKFMPPKYQTGVIWKDRCAIGNLLVRDTGAEEGEELDVEAGGIHKSRLRFSRAFKPDIFPANYFIDVIPDGKSGRITKLFVSPKIDALLVFMDDDLVAITGDTPLGERGQPFRPRNIANSKGTPAPGSVVEADGLVFYWTKNGIEVLNGFSSRNITSETIAPLWNAQTGSDRINMAQMDKVRSAYDQRNNRIYWAYCSGAAIENDAILVLHLDRWFETGARDGVFSIDTGWNISDFMVWNGEGDSGEIFGGEANDTDEAHIYRLYFENVDQNTTNTTDSEDAIVAKVHMGLTDFGAPAILKRLHSCVIEIKCGDNSTEIDLDHDRIGSVREIVSAFNMGIAADTDIINWITFPLRRQEIAMRAGLQFAITDTVTGSPGTGPIPWELFSVGFRVSEIKTRMRPVA